MCLWSVSPIWVSYVVIPTWFTYVFSNFRCAMVSKHLDLVKKQTKMCMGGLLLPWASMFDVTLALLRHRLYGAQVALLVLPRISRSSYWLDSVGNSPVVGRPAQPLGRLFIKHGLHWLQDSGSFPPPLGERHRQGNSREATKWSRLTRKFGQPATHWAHMLVAFAHDLLVLGVFWGGIYFGRIPNFLVIPWIAPIWLLCSWNQIDTKIVELG
jgi:hypothetical protein